MIKTTNDPLKIVMLGDGTLNNYLIQINFKGRVGKTSLTL